MLSVEPIRTRTCLSNFRSGVREIDVFARRVFASEPIADDYSETYCLYDAAAPDTKAVGFYTLSRSHWTQWDERFKIKNVQLELKSFLYIDYFSLIKSYQRSGLASWLMADAFARAKAKMNEDRDLLHLGLNVHSEVSAYYFWHFWNFFQVTTTAHPLMVVSGSAIKEMLAFHDSTNAKSAL